MPKGVYQRTKPVSLETRKKRSQALKGRKRTFTPEWIAKLAEKNKARKTGHWTGKILSLDHRKKLSEAHKGAKSNLWKGGISAEPNYRTVHSQLRRCRVAKAQGSFTVRQWNSLKSDCNNTCLCCGRQEPEIKLTADHIIPVSKGGKNTIDNIQPLCGSCNSKKGIKVIDFNAS